MHAPSTPISALVLAFAATLVVAPACTSQPGDPQPGSSALPNMTAPQAARTPHAPQVMASPPVAHSPVGGTTFLVAGDITLEGDAVPGSASFDGAVVWDARSEQEPTAVGAGTFAVTIGGTLYQSGGAESMAFVVPDENGTDYLVLGAYAIETDGNGVDVGSIVYVIVPAADFAPGATVSLDGNERLALFGWGPIDTDAPQVAGAAITGQLTFVSGSLTTGAAVTATLAADFAAATWPEPTDPGDPPVGDPVNNVVPGTYALAFAAQADAYCEGSLAGKEADFALAPAAVGLADGTVTVAILTPEQMALSGSVLTAAFGGDTLGLDWLGDPSMPGLFIGYAEAGAAGPLGTLQSVTFLALDGETATASTIQAAGGAEFDDRSAGGGGWCGVQWSATLTAAQ
jgi:hypothetical protein